jgi:hypothetical protein
MSSGPDTFDLTVYTTETLDLTLTLYTGAVGSTPVDLTGSSAALVIKDRPGGDTLVTLTPGSGLTLGGSAGTIQIKRTPGQISAWTFENATYQLSKTSSGGDVDLLLIGSIERIVF